MKRSPIKRGPRRKKPHPNRKPARKKPPSKLTQRNQCDAIFSKLVRARDRVCLACGSGALLQCAHIVSRRYFAVRWDFTNAVTLCMGCHKKFTHDPIGWDLWVIGRFGAEFYEDLKRRAYVITKPDYDPTLADLRERMKEIA